jgi:hypothetical protein
MKTTLENISGFDVLHVEGSYSWSESCNLPAKLQGEHGISDWVLPDRVTLAAVSALTAGGDGWYWSATPYAGSSGSAWFVGFANGYVNNNYCAYSLKGRLVRASQCLEICMAAAKQSIKEVGIGDRT